MQGICSHPEWLLISMDVFNMDLKTDSPRMRKALMLETNVILIQATSRY